MTKKIEFKMNSLVIYNICRYLPHADIINFCSQFRVNRMRIYKMLAGQMAFDLRRLTWSADVELIEAVLRTPLANPDDCLKVAAKMNRRDIVDLAIKYDASLFNKGIHAAGKLGNYNMFVYLAEKTAEDNGNWLYAACKGGNIDIVKYCENAGAHGYNLELCYYFATEEVQNYLYDKYTEKIRKIKHSIATSNWDSIPLIACALGKINTHRHTLTYKRLSLLYKSLVEFDYVTIYSYSEYIHVNSLCFEDICILINCVKRNYIHKCRDNKNIIGALAVKGDIYGLSLMDKETVLSALLSAKRLRRSKKIRIYFDIEDFE